MEYIYIALAAAEVADCAARKAIKTANDANCAATAARVFPGGPPDHAKAIKMLAAAQNALDAAVELRNAAITYYEATRDLIPPKND
jgi:hypothetical protein